MIDDIVELPRQLKNRASCGRVSTSYMAYERPVSPFGIMLGMTTPETERDLPVCLGNEFEQLCGQEAFYRYKAIERTEDHILEYVIISDDPMNSMTASLFALWVNIVNKADFTVRRVYFWDNIAKARERFGFQDCALLNRTTEESVSLAEIFTGYPGLKRAYDASCITANGGDELNDINTLLTIQGNYEVMKDADAFGYMYHPTDLFRGTNLDESQNIFKLVTAASRLLSTGIITTDDFKWMRSPSFITKPYHMCLRETKPITKDTCIDAMTEFISGWFSVLKYIELIPYGETFIRFNQRTADVIRAIDPYDSNHYIDFEYDRLNTEMEATVKQIMDALTDILHDYTTVTIYRSWGEEVYITVTNSNGTTDRYFFDLVYNAIGSRMFVPKDNNK